MYYIILHNRSSKSTWKCSFLFIPWYICTFTDDELYFWLDWKFIKWDICISVAYFSFNISFTSGLNWVMSKISHGLTTLFCTNLNYFFKAINIHMKIYNLKQSSGHVKQDVCINYNIQTQQQTQHISVQINDPRIGKNSQT